jgi:NitT/TauT family transport system permease protein
MRDRLHNTVLGLIPLILFLVAWQLWCQDSHHRIFLFATPELVLRSLAAGLMDGTLIHHTLVTGGEALTGFALGVTLGSVTGFLLLYVRRVSAIAQPYVFALGATPIFAIAPMMIVWFGIGFKMKVAMAFFSTLFVALAQAYRGGRSVDGDLVKLFVAYAASNWQTFWKLVFPSSLDWVFASLRMTVNLALLGAFIGEFIAAESGLGYAIVKAGGTYDVPRVLAGVVCIIALASAFNGAVMLLERYRHRIVSALTVPGALR